MSKFGIIVNVDKCIGCQACFVACKDENKVAPGIQWNQIQRNENIEARVINYFRVSCQHCENPSCMKICPQKAIYNGPGGEVLVDSAKCIGCKMCYMACPYKVPKFNESGRTNYFDKPPLVEAPLAEYQVRPAGKAERCTLCVHRTSKGKIPRCVEACAINALTFIDYENLNEDQQKLLQRSVKLNEAAGTNPKLRYISTYCDMAHMKPTMI